MLAKTKLIDYFIVDLEYTGRYTRITVIRDDTENVTFYDVILLLRFQCISILLTSVRDKSLTFYLGVRHLLCTM